MEDSAHNTPIGALGSVHKGFDGAQTDVTLESRKALISTADMATVRSRLSPELSARCSDETINQFLRAAESNISQVLHTPHRSLPLLTCSCDKIGDLMECVL